MSEYTQISQCGKYGLKPYGGNSEGGELWAWINEDFASKVGELWDCENFLTAIDNFEEEMQCIMEEFQ